MKIRGLMNWVMVVGILAVVAGVYVAGIGTTEAPPSAEQDEAGRMIATSGIIAMACVTLASNAFRLFERKGAASR